MQAKIGPILCLAGALAAGCLSGGPARAENEFRAGLMFQIPFGGSKGGSFVHFADTRIGAKVQYASIDDIVKQREQLIDRVYKDGVLQNSVVYAESVTTLSDGDTVSGAEAYLLVTPFNRRWNVSGGINGFTGGLDFQGALGIGLDPTFGFYAQAGVLMPYSEAGVRFNFSSIDFFAGMTSLGGFSQKTVWKDDIVTYFDTYNTTPKAEEPAPETPATSIIR